MSLFGSKPNMFGGGISTSQTGSGGQGLFGSSTTTNAGLGSSTGGGLFGSTGGGLFGSSTPAPSSGGLLGSNTTGGLFGSSTPAQTGGGLLGSTGGGGLFGSSTPANTGGGLLGSTTTGGGMFGSSTPAATSGGLFGASTQGGSTGGLLGSTATGGGLFGSTAPSTGGLLGPTSGGGGLFGSNIASASTSSPFQASQGLASGSAQVTAELLQSFEHQLRRLQEESAPRFITFSYELTNQSFEHNIEEQRKYKDDILKSLACAYQKAQQDNPDPDTCNPYPVVGFQALLQKVTVKHSLLDTVIQELEKSQKDRQQLKSLLESHTFERVAECKRRLSSLQHKTVAVAAKLQEYAIQNGVAKIDHLRLRAVSDQLASLENRLLQTGSSKSRISEITIILNGMQSKLKTVNKANEAIKDNTGDIDMSRVKADLSICDLQGELIETLRSVVKANQKDLAEIESFTGPVVPRRGSFKTENVQFPSFSGA
eukprot:GHVL01006616.1.p1 GENE.GHVL01006616.1~~GHVL01006616.1.p1  ORF type:complete len:483 (-),score=100.10 GHVL01006616.1:117-1565(-)